MTEVEALIALNQVPKTGPVKIRRLIDTCGSAQKALSASVHELQQVQGIGPETANLIKNWEDHADPSREIQRAAERDIQILTRECPDYPKPLLASFDAPVILYVWGELQERDAHAIGIVGSRKLTHYGREASRKFAYQLASAGMTIISGLARGIDTAAHEGAIAAKGRTIGVLGSGLLQLYPPENLALAEKIASGYGAIISEFPLDTKPDKKTFPQRNRIVANWSQALVVVECPIRSGSLITANLANDAGKTIYAIPGPIDRPSSGGCHALIRAGATLVTDGSQILEDFGQFDFQENDPSPNQTRIDLSKEEQLIVEAMAGREISIDELVQETSLPSHQISVSLMRLELNAIVLTLPGQRYRLR